MPTVFLTAEWRDLLLLNYEIDPVLLRALVPTGTELDCWEGRSFVSLVGFRFLNTRVLGAAIPGHRHFDEVNLRFYVRRRGPGGLRRGVVFIREIVPRRAVAWIARALYGEPYIALPMRHRVEPGRLAYGWRFARRWHEMTASMSGDPLVPGDDTLEAFITEHYWGYTAGRRGSTREYRVEHPRWRVWRSADAALACDAAALYGPAFGAVLGRSPVSALVADGSPVTVQRGARIA